MKQKRWKTDGYLRIFASYYRPHWKLFALDMVCALCICLVDLAFPIVSRFSMQTLLPGQMFTAFFVVMAVLAGAYVLKGCFYYIITYWGHLLGVRMEADIRRDLFSHMQDLSFSFYDKNRTGPLMSRVTTDLFEITELAHHGPEDLFISTVTLAGAFLVMLTIRWELALIVFAVIPLFILFTTLCRKRMMRASTEVKAKLAGINGEVESSISGMRTAKAFANEAAESAKFDQANDQFRGAKRGYYRAMAFYQSGMEFFMGILSVVVIAFGGFLLMRGRMDLIDLTTFFLYISTFITPIRKLSAFVEQFMQGMAGFKRFVALMRVEPDIQDEPDAQELTDVKGDIRVEDVTFRYEPSDPPVLEHVTLHVRPGETVAVVGPSGGGKSTLCQLIPRFYDVTGGAVLVDGLDVRDYPLEELRKRIGMVLQNNVLFTGTIRENLLWGRPDATEEEMIQAAKNAQAYDFVMGLPDGFDTQMAQGGTNVSGGQKQRLCIARAMLRHPAILILDDSTSAVDTATDAKIRQSFKENLAGTTVIIIAQRISSVQYADRILVLDGGRVSALGAHRELIDRPGIYRDIYDIQMRSDDRALVEEGGNA